MRPKVRAANLWIAGRRTCRLNLRNWACLKIAHVTTIANAPCSAVNPSSVPVPAVRGHPVDPVSVGVPAVLLSHHLQHLMILEATAAMCRRQICQKITVIFHHHRHHHLHRHLAMTSEEVSGAIQTSHHHRHHHHSKAAATSKRKLELAQTLRCCVGGVLLARLSPCALILGKLQLSWFPVFFGGGGPNAFGICAKGDGGQNGFAVLSLEVKVSKAFVL